MPPHLVRTVIVKNKISWKKLGEDAPALVHLGAQIERALMFVEDPESQLWLSSSCMPTLASTPSSSGIPSPNTPACMPTLEDAKTQEFPDTLINVDSDAVTLDTDSNVDADVDTH